MIGYYFGKIFRKIFLRATVRGSKVDKTARFDVMSSITSSEFGKYSYAGANTTVSNTKVGNFTSISAGCSIGGGAHPIDWVSTSPAFTRFKSILGFRFADNDFVPHKQTVIGNDVWIGANCMVKSGVTIHDGAVIGMGSVVTKDVGPYEIWAGNPARMIRRRHPEDLSSRLQATDWYHWDDEKIKKYAGLFDEPEKFLKALEEEKA